MTDAMPLPMHALAMIFLGEFAKVQDQIVGLLQLHREHWPDTSLGEELGALLERNLRDDDRKKYFKKISAVTGCDMDLTHFGEVWGETKRLRDVVAHASISTETGPDEIGFVKSFFSVGSSSAAPVSVTRAELRTRTKEAQWLSAVATYVIASQPNLKMIALNGRRVKFVAPPANPTDYEQLQWWDLGSALPS